MVDLSRVKVRVRSALWLACWFGKTHPKKVEAIGLIVALLAGFLQVQADGYRQTLGEFKLELLSEDIAFSQQQVMGLIECQAANSCQPFDRSRVKVETGVIEGDTPQRYAFWSRLRLAAFALGSFLILLGKWLDGLPLAWPTLPVTKPKTSAFDPTDVT